MDLSSIFGLNSRFGALLGRINPFSAAASITLAETSVYQRVNGGPRVLEPSGRRRPGFAGQGSLSHWASCASVRVVTDECDEKSVVIENSPHAVRTLDDLTRIKGPAQAELGRGTL